MATWRVSRAYRGAVDGCEVAEVTCSTLVSTNCTAKAPLTLVSEAKMDK